MVNGLSIYILRMNIWALIYWRPQYWNDITFTRFLWRRVYESYATLHREESKLISFLAKHKRGSLTPQMTHKALSRVENAWNGVKVSGHSLQNITFKSLQLTPKETMIYFEYREAAYRVFDRYCRMIFDAELAEGYITLAEWEKRMQGIKKQALLLIC